VGFVYVVVYVGCVVGGEVVYGGGGCYLGVFC